MNILEEGPGRDDFFCFLSSPYYILVHARTCLAEDYFSADIHACSAAFIRDWTSAAGEEGVRARRVLRTLRF